jgi:serine/threonine-protein kinase
MKICPRCSDLHSDEATLCPKDGSELREVRDPLIGRTVGGRYRLISRLGSGGMSAVYLARHVMIERLVAVKALRRDLSKDEVQRDRFMREARAVNRINHENIVEIFDVGETDDGLVYLVMEYVPGDSLLKALAQAPFPAARAISIGSQAAGALGRAHQMGVIHRDLKPENILLVQRKERADFVKLLDFGIAKLIDAPSITGSQQIFGTPGYIAPEYIQSTRIDGRSDLYSLGVILYEMCTGALPFDYQYPGDLLVKHVTEQPIPPRTRHPAIEPALEELILRALRKDPRERFRDAYHFLEELDRVRERLGPETSWGAMSEPPAGVDIDIEVGEVEDERATPADDEVARREMLETMEQPREARDTLLDVPRAPFVTSEYGRPSAPSSPGASGAPSAQSERAPVTPINPSEDGLFGVRRWRRRHDALRDTLEEVAVGESPPAEVARAISLAGALLERLEREVPAAEQHQREIEEVENRARDFRATLGRAIDEAARKLSTARGELEQIATRRNELREQRAAVLRKVRGGQAAEGRADALLWELAAIEEELEKRGHACDELEAKLSELQSRLDAENERFEKRIADAVSVLAGEMIALERLAAELRDPLDQVEAHLGPAYARRRTTAPEPAGKMN